jgi:hypothetical protein
MAVTGVEGRRPVGLQAGLVSLGVDHRGGVGVQAQVLGPVRHHPDAVDGRVEVEPEVAALQRDGEGRAHGRDGPALDVDRVQPLAAAQRVQHIALDAVVQAQHLLAGLQAGQRPARQQPVGPRGVEADQVVRLGHGHRHLAAVRGLRALRRQRAAWRCSSRTAR